MYIPSEPWPGTCLGLVQVLRFYKLLILGGNALPVAGLKQGENKHPAAVRGGALAGGPGGPGGLGAGATCCVPTQQGICSNPVHGSRPGRSSEPKGGVASWLLGRLWSSVGVSLFPAQPSSGQKLSHPFGYPWSWQIGSSTIILIRKQRDGGIRVRRSKCWCLVLLPNVEARTTTWPRNVGPSLPRSPSEGSAQIGEALKPPHTLDLLPSLSNYSTGKAVVSSS
jgi:hypothetical protein